MNKSTTIALQVAGPSQAEDQSHEGTRMTCETRATAVFSLYAMRMSATDNPAIDQYTYGIKSTELTVAIVTRMASSVAVNARAEVLKPLCRETAAGQSGSSQRSSKIDLIRPDRSSVLYPNMC